MELHYSQTETLPSSRALWFYYHMELHYSQTFSPCVTCINSFTTIWNYTTLKHKIQRSLRNFRFTTIWNYTTLKRTGICLSSTRCFTTIWNYTTLKLSYANMHEAIQFYYHMELHYSQTAAVASYILPSFYYHMELHYSQTDLITPSVGFLFYYHMELHYSQTFITTSLNLFAFYYHMELHYSQTRLLCFNIFTSFTTIWNYTTLKLCSRITHYVKSFTTIWNYTTLKLIGLFAGIYLVLLPYGITLLSNPYRSGKAYMLVLLPYGITLLSNCLRAVVSSDKSFTTIWNYTTLKLILNPTLALPGFTTIWNYTTLKRTKC